MRPKRSFVIDPSLCKLSEREREIDIQRERERGIQRERGIDR